MAAWHQRRRGRAISRACDELERVNLMGSPTGDGAIEALQGKPRLRHFSTGTLVTDAGLPLLQNFPRLKEWQAAGRREGTRRRRRELLIDGRSPTRVSPAWPGSTASPTSICSGTCTGVTAAGFAHLQRLAEPDAARRRRPS